MEQNHFAAGTGAKNSFVDSTLISLYHQDDRRLQAFFTFDERGRANRNSIYTTTISPFNCFTGLATDEVVLVKAECHARLGDLASAAETFDLLLRKRMAPGSFGTTVFCR